MNIQTEHKTYPEMNMAMFRGAEAQSIGSEYALRVYLRNRKTKEVKGDGDTRN